MNLISFKLWVLLIWPHGEKETKTSLFEMEVCGGPLCVTEGWKEDTVAAQFI